jgi:hypothetical protein
MRNKVNQAPIDYLIIGHLTTDLTPQGPRPGGTAAYSALTAQAMGLNVGIVTAGNQEDDLSHLTGISIIQIPSKTSTVFENQYTDAGRIQFLKQRAVDLTFQDVPEEWKRSPIIHLAPVAREVPFPTREDFPYSALGCSLQGWLRKWDKKGAVYPAPLPEFPSLEKPDRTAILSLEDITGKKSWLEPIRSRFPLVILTKGAAGAEYYQGELTGESAALETQEVDPTGAGDIFAASFLIYYFLRGMDLQRSVWLAGLLGSWSVSRTGLEGVPDPAVIKSIEKAN